MIIADFKQLVLDYMNRDSTLFDRNSTLRVDKLLQAANNAKAWAQRKLVLELARTKVDVVIDKTNGGSLLTAVSHANGVTPVRVQTVEKAFLPTSDNLNITPVDIVNRDSNVRFVQRLTDNVFDPLRRTLPTQPLYTQIVKHGNELRLYPWDDRLYTGQTIIAVFDVVQWMPPYEVDLSGTATMSGAGVTLTDAGKTFIDSGVVAGSVIYNQTTGTSTTIAAVVSNTVLTLTSGAIFVTGNSYKIGLGVQEDFFLKDCIDWMMYKTIQELNMFLKEDQRVQISSAMMKDAWETVVNWNSRLTNTQDELSLD